MVKSGSSISSRTTDIHSTASSVNRSEIVVATETYLFNLFYYLQEHRHRKLAVVVCIIELFQWSLFGMDSRATNWGLLTIPFTYLNILSSGVRISAETASITSLVAISLIVITAILLLWV